MQEEDAEAEDTDLRAEDERAAGRETPDPGVPQRVDDRLQFELVARRSLAQPEPSDDRARAAAEGKHQEGPAPDPVAR